VARMGLRWGKGAWVAVAALCAFGAYGCSDEDEPDTGTDAAADTSTDRRTDVSVGTDVSSDVSATDRTDTSTTADARTDTVAPDGRSDGGTPDGTSGPHHVGPGAVRAAKLER